MLRSPLLPPPCHLVTFSPGLFEQIGMSSSTWKVAATQQATTLSNFMPMALLWPRTTSTINATSAKMASTMPKVIGTSITLCIGHIAWTAAPPVWQLDVFQRSGGWSYSGGFFCRSMKTTAATMNFILGDDVNDSELASSKPNLCPVSFQNFLLKL